MDDAERHRLATMIDLALRETTSPHERDAALSRIKIATGGRSLADLVKDICADKSEVLVAPPLKPRERMIPWLEYKANHEATVVELERMRRQLARYESPRYDKYRVKPDEDGNIPYSTFLIALLAVREWQVQDALSEFSQLAKVDRMEVTHWRERGKAPYYYYQLLPELPFNGVRSDRITWTEAATEMLKEYFAAQHVLPDIEIAKLMTDRLGILVSERAVQSKAYKLGLLTNVKRAGRRLKSSGRSRPAGDISPLHKSD